jgi:hypothetical protein
MRPVTASLEEGAWGRNLAKVSLPLTQPNRLLHYGPPSPRVEINNLRGLATPQGLFPQPAKLV